MPVEKLDLLVHPFCSIVSDAAPRREAWFERIDMIAGNPNHHIALRLVGGGNQKEKGERKRLVEYARKKLGKDRVIVVHDRRLGLHGSYKAIEKEVRQRGYDANRIKIHIYGEWLPLCVKSAIWQYATKVG